LTCQHHVVDVAVGPSFNHAARIVFTARTRWCHVACPENLARGTGRSPDFTVRPRGTSHTLGWSRDNLTFSLGNSCCGAKTAIQNFAFRAVSASSSSRSCGRSRVAVVTAEPVGGDSW